MEEYESAQQWVAYNLRMIDFLGLEDYEWSEAHNPWDCMQTIVVIA